MSVHCVYALGQDAYWVDAMVRSGDESVRVQPIRCPGGYDECLGQVAEIARDVLLFVDATDQQDVVATAARLQQLGFRYVVVVAADPSAREAHAVFQEGKAFDYIQKTYVSQVIRADIARCLAEIEEIARGATAPLPGAPANADLGGGSNG